MLKASDDNPHQEPDHPIGAVGTKKRSIMDEALDVPPTQTTSDTVRLGGADRAIRIYSRTRAIEHDSPGQRTRVARRHAAASNELI